MSGKEHTPSRYRAIIQESKSGKGRPVAKLVEDALSMPDSYFSALALFGISGDRRVSEAQSRNLIKDSIQLSDKEARLWRKAELLTLMCQKAKNHPLNTHELIRSQIMEKLWAFPEGKDQSAAVIGCADFLGCQYFHGLLKLAIGNPGFEMEAGKPVIRQWVKDCSSSQGISAEDIANLLAAMPEGLVKVKLHGYLHIQLTRAGNEGLAVLENALSHAMKLSGDDRIQAIKYLIDQSPNLESLELLAKGITELGEPTSEAGLFSTLAANADKAGRKDLALDWFTTGLDIIENVDDPEQRALVRIKLATGLERLGNSELAENTLNLALTDAEGNETTTAKVQRAMGVSPDEPKDRKDTMPVHDTKNQDKANRHVLGLYDTYEGGMKPVHIRMVARAAPLCIAYNLDLALFGFPERDLNNLVRKVLNDTNIGKGGMYLKELQKHGRISLISCSQQVPPSAENWKEIGLPIATTSRPAKGKETSLEKALEKAMAHPKKRLCLIMGLGKKGLPISLMNSAEFHVELTGSNIALETSTAMGIIAQQLGSLRG
ncbi:MAG: DUF531 domain-containing protein [Candidatus Thermoplasmatota archaeon]|nr:DUF531 domain-containing protein [Euryarchaeota archaeon]MBU4032362.1 DUF531 domain-containing protein [Candidatus Thermoplasmatota archaeon]MBU4071865.1 DUF531 domain-containing protein [Candidatus Thermoplasmatota archaeon]MBU4144016.1 DUF531 domain-containing protein [Candidatus Thermoplasmatota archaeon]MBU4591870.1 DUF531 domain-containing protein [Candidatus Thermoplasmatota archaeon]